MKKLDLDFCFYTLPVISLTSHLSYQSFVLPVISLTSYLLPFWYVSGGHHSHGRVVVDGVVGVGGTGVRQHGTKGVNSPHSELIASF